MINYLKGYLELSEVGTFVTVVAGAVGYKVMVHDRDGGVLRQRGNGGDVVLFCRLVDKGEAGSVLVGFIDPYERELFDKVTAIQGIGERTAMLALSVLNADKFVAAVKAVDEASFFKVKGIGPKIATKLARLKL